MPDRALRAKLSVIRTVASPAHHSSDILIYCSVIAGVLALYRLRRAYTTHVSSVGGFPEIEGNQLTRWLGIASPIFLPLVFLIAWLIVWSQAHT